MPITNAVVDLSHHNQSPDFKKAKADGIAGVIQKATQGLTYVDPTYKTNLANARAQGLLWGAYHFGTGDDGVQQAEYFLKTVGKANASSMLLVLDFEENPVGPTMQIGEARAFVTHIQQVTGRWPGLYGGHMIKSILGTGTDPVLSNCWFWLAQYGPTPVVPSAWAAWTMWQYTDGAAGKPPYSVNGIGTCDRDKFQGSLADLQSFWANSGKTATA